MRRGLPPTDTKLHDVLSQNLQSGDWVPRADYTGWREVSSVLRTADQIVVDFTNGSKFRWVPFTTVRIRR